MMTTYFAWGDGCISWKRKKDVEMLVAFEGRDDVRLCRKREKDEDGRVIIIIADIHTASILLRSFSLCT